MNTIKPVNHLTGIEIRAFTPEQLNTWSPEMVQQLTPIQLQSLTTTQLREMRKDLLESLSSLQVSVFGVRQLQALVDAGLDVEVPNRHFVASVDVVQNLAHDHLADPTMHLEQVLAGKIEAAAHVMQDVAPKARVLESFATQFEPSLEPHRAPSNAQTVQSTHLKKPQHKTKAAALKKQTAKESFSLARSSIYMAVIALFSSGDFLVGAYSQENDVLNAVWEAHQKQTHNEAGAGVVTTPIRFKEPSPEQVAIAALPPESATAVPATISGLVLPPESATVSVPKARQSAAISEAAPAVPVSVSGVPKRAVQSVLERSDVKLPDTKRDAKSAAAVPTLHIFSAPETEKKMHAAAKGGHALAQSEQATVIERYMKELPNKTVVLASLGADREVMRLGQANAAALPPIPYVGRSAAAAIPASPEVTPTSESRMREVSGTARNADPDRYNASSWTSMKVSTDLPQKIAELGEDLISVVVSELPEKKRQQSAMPYDEFKSRVKEAVESNPDVGVYTSQVGQAQSGKSIAYAGMLPQVSGNADTGKRTVGRDPYTGTSAYARNGTNYGVTVSQLLFDFGSSLFGFRAGEARTIAAKELLNSKRSEQALKSITAFVELERAKAQLALAKQNASSRLAIVKLVKERSQIGGGSMADIVRVESKYAEALSTISLAETRLNNAESTYREAFGVGPKGVVNGPLHEFPIVGLNKTAEELAGTYPGLLQLAKLREASQADYNSTVAKTLPSFQLVYNNSIAGMNAPANSGMNGMAVDPSRSSSIVFQLKYEFYTGGADTARKSEAMYKAQQALQEFESGMRAYQKVLSQSQSEIRNNEELIASRRAAANSAIDSMRAVREQFSFNKGSLLDLITVQEGLFGAGRDLIDAMADRALVRYRLLHLTAELDKMFELNNIASLNARD